MKTNKLITVLGFTLLVGSIAYSMQQLTLERKTQEQIKVSFNKQAIKIKNLQISAEKFLFNGNQTNNHFRQPLYLILK